MEDVEVRKIVRVIDHEGCMTYEVSNHEDSDEWLEIRIPDTDDTINIRVETALKLAKAIIEVYSNATLGS
jgi:hypothetical protein